MSDRRAVPRSLAPHRGEGAERAKGAHSDRRAVPRSLAPPRGEGAERAKGAHT
jgi:hypothetical protein